MRSREEIEREMIYSYDFEALIVEVLLDIRDVKTSEAKWGIYCPQHYGSWYNRPDGEIYSYPTEEVAKAHLEAMAQCLVNVENHLWEVIEFGKQKYVDPDKAPAGTEICPVRYPPHFTEAF